MSLSYFPVYFERPRAAWRNFARRIAEYMPKGLYARSLLIVIVPMVVLQSAIAYFFMERHWQLVTFRLSTAVVQDIASVADLYRANPSPENVALLQKIAAQRLGLDVQINRLRRKIEVDPTNPQHLQTARGAGYRLMLDR